MQRRERLLAIAVGALVGLWALDAGVIEPGLAWLARTRTEAREANAAAAESGLLVDRSKQILDRWRAWHASGVLDGEDAARFRTQQAVTAAARVSGCSVDALSGGQRSSAAQGQFYDTLRLTVTGQGSLAEVQGFLAALENAPQALRIERCELASRDPRKDALDVSLTLSTRIASAEARAARTVPTDTPAWKPDARDEAVDRAVRDARPFLTDRRRPAPGATTAAAAPTETPPGTWALVGVVGRSDGAIGLLRHLGTGEERTVRAGDDLDGARIAALDGSGMRLAAAGGEKAVAIGTDLDGHAVPGGRIAAARPTTAAATAPPAAPGAAPAAPSDTDRDAILQRLRERRNRAPGNSP